MSDNRLEELQDPETWDAGSVSRRPGRRQGRSVVSVAFAKDQFQRIAERAELEGRPVSAFIRDCTLRIVDQPILTVRMAFGSVSGGTSFFESTGNELTKSGSAIQEQSFDSEKWLARTA